MTQAEGTRTETPGSPARAPTVPKSGQPDAAAARDSADPASAALPVAPIPAATTASAATTEPAVKAADAPPAKAAAAIRESPDSASAAAIDAKLKAELAQSLGSLDAPHIEVKATAEGIEISLTDATDFSMFGSDRPFPIPRSSSRSTRLPMCRGSPGQYRHTRLHPHAASVPSGTYDNWGSRAPARTWRTHAHARQAAGRAHRTDRGTGRPRSQDIPTIPMPAENRRIAIVLQEAAS